MTFPAIGKLTCCLVKKIRLSGPIAKEMKPTKQDNAPWAIIRPPSWRTCLIIGLFAAAGRCSLAASLHVKQRILDDSEQVLTVSIRQGPGQSAQLVAGDEPFAE